MFEACSDESFLFTNCSLSESVMETELLKWKQRIEDPKSQRTPVGWFLASEDGKFEFVPNDSIPEGIFQPEKVQNETPTNSDPKPTNPASHSEEGGHERERGSERSLLGSKDANEITMKTKSSSESQTRSDGKQVDVGKLVKNWCGGKWILAADTRFQHRDFQRFVGRFVDTCAMMSINEQDRIKLLVLRHQSDDKAQKMVDMAVNEHEMKKPGTWDGKFDFVVDWIKKYLAASCNRQAEKRLLKSMKQEQNESFILFANRVIDQSELCGYSDQAAKENAMDTIINNCTNSKRLYRMTIQEKNIEDLDLQTVMRWGSSLEIGETAIEEKDFLSVNTVQSSKFSRQKQQGRMLGQPGLRNCTKCASREHETKNCWLWEEEYRDMTCHRCNGKGHLRRACTAPLKRNFDRSWSNGQGSGGSGNSSKFAKPEKESKSKNSKSEGKVSKIEKIETNENLDSDTSSD